MNAVLSRPSFIARGAQLIAVAIVVVAIVLLASGGSSYVLRLTMSNAAGLRPGSQVLLGGVSVGTVNSLNLNKQNVVVADLHLNRNQVHIGQGASASVVAANLLGEKYVSLQPGNTSDPLPSGTTLPQSATTLPTDLDQIVGVLDDQTRSDLATLLNEAGTSVAGRRADVGAILRQFPLSLTAATQLLTTMVQDNHTLGDLVSNSNQFISRINTQSGDLQAAIDSGASAVNALAQKQSQLAATVAGVPGVLRSFTDTFVEGRAAVLPLVTAAPQVANIAPQLDQLLKAVAPFTAAAVPTLNRAASVAPTLTELADKATPTVQQAVPTLASLSNIAKLAQPLSGWLGLSSNDVFGILQGWTRAIQYRDGLSHIFNGDVYLSPAIVLNAANMGATAAQKRQNLLDILSPSILRTLGLQGAYNAAKEYKAPAPASHVAKPKTTAKPSAPAPHITLPTVPAIQKVITGVTKNTTSGLTNLLNGLLGSLSGKGGAGGSGAGASTGASTGNSASSSNPVGSLQNLLNYLLGK